MFPHVVESNALDGDSGFTTRWSPIDRGDGEWSINGGAARVKPSISHQYNDENVRKRELTGYLYTANRSDHVSARFEPIRMDSDSCGDRAGTLAGLLRTIYASSSAATAGFAALSLPPPPTAT